MKPYLKAMSLMIGLLWMAGSVQAQMGHQRMMEQMPGSQKEQGAEQKMMGMGSAAAESYGEGPFDIEAMKERLNLTGEQMAKLKKLRSDYTKEMIKRRANLRVAELDLFELLDAKTLDMEAAEKKVKELEAGQADLWLYRIKALKETSRFLTEDQFDQFRKMGFKFMRRMMGRHGMDGGMMGGGMHGG